MKIELDKLFFTSDLHVFDKNILRHQKRSIENLENMNSTIINNWNSVVPADGIVYNLGDFLRGGYNNRKDLIDYINQLNGVIYLIPGNHDKLNLLVELSNNELKGKLFICNLIEILNLNIKDDYYQKIVLCHYPMREWPSYFRNSWHLYGHTHGNLKPFKCSMDVGIDNHIEFRPFTFLEVFNFMKERRNI